MFSNNSALKKTQYIIFIIKNKQIKGQDSLNIFISFTKNI